MYKNENYGKIEVYSNWIEVLDTWTVRFI